MKKFILPILFLLLAFNANSQDMPDLLDVNEKSGIVISAEDMDFGDETVDAFGNEIKPQIINHNSAQGKKSQQLKINTRKSLTDNLKENAPEDAESGKEATNWVQGMGKNIKGLITSGKNKSSNDSLSNMLDQSKGLKRKSNAAVFDIAGVMLTMNYKQSEDALLKRGYKKISQKLDIPNFIKWRNEETCRNRGVVGYERLNNCIIQLSRTGNYEFISQTEFNKFDTKETVKVFYTSNFTGNKVYKIIYRTEAANISGSSAKSKYLRKIKVLDFWKKINQKYGYPDDEQEVLWGLGGDSPYMKASTGILLLENNMLLKLDQARMSREDARFINTDVYNF